MRHFFYKRQTHEEIKEPPSQTSPGDKYGKLFHQYSLQIKVRGPRLGIPNVIAVLRGVLVLVMLRLSFTQICTVNSEMFVLHIFSRCFRFPNIYGYMYGENRLPFLKENV